MFLKITKLSSKSCMRNYTCNGQLFLYNAPYMGRKSIEGEGTPTPATQSSRRWGVVRSAFIVAGVVTSFSGPTNLISNTLHRAADNATYEPSPRAFYTALGLAALGEVVVAGAAFFPKIKEIFVASRNRRAKVIYTSGENVRPPQDARLKNI